MIEEDETPAERDARRNARAWVLWACIAGCVATLAFIWWVF